MNPNIKILTIGSEKDSAERLGYPTNHLWGDYSTEQQTNKDLIIIRWGNSRLVRNRKTGNKDAEFNNVINPASAIQRNVDKRDATKLLSQVVNVPTLYEKTVPKDVLAVIRPLKHTAGREFTVVRGPHTIVEGTYGARFLRTNIEYRVWFCGKKTMMSRRVKMDTNPTTEFACRSKYGYACDKNGVVIYIHKVPLDLHYQTLMAALKIGLDFGAADVLFYNEKYYFLELNSAPSVDHRGIRLFFQENLETLATEKFGLLSPQKDMMTVPVIDIKPASTPKKIEKKAAPPVTEKKKVYSTNTWW